MKRHKKATLISAEYCLRKEMSKTNRPQADDKLIDHFAQINKHEQLHNTEMEERDTVPKTMQPPRHLNIEHSEEMKQIRVK